MISDVTNSTFSVNRLIAALGNGSAASCSDCGGSASQQRLNATEEVLRNGPVGKSELTEEEKAQVEELKQRDAEVRRHEQAHKTAAGSLATGGPSFEYQSGPDGGQYAIGGEVQIDTSAVPDNPQATIQKMQRVRAAALAPAEPSSQDRQVAAKAAQIERQAQAELREQETADETGESGEVGASHGPSGVATSQNGIAVARQDNREAANEIEIAESASEAASETESANPAAFIAGGLTAQPAEARRAVNASETPRTVEFKALLNLQQALVPGRFIDVAA